MRFLLGICLFLFLSQPAWCEVVLLTPSVHNGEVAVLQWRGKPPSFGVARFMDQVIYLYPDVSGAIALLPVGLDATAGLYPISVAVVDKRGETQVSEHALQVVWKERPVEHLRLPEKMVSPSGKDLERIAADRALLENTFTGRSDRIWTTFQAPVKASVSSVFGKRRIMNGKPRAPHSGTDYRSPRGTPVSPISNGRVVLVADLFYTGKTVVVDHGEGLFSLYAHLSKVLVAEGHELLVGDVLGEVGSTGRSTGAHLHLSVKLLGERVDPESLLGVL